MQHAGILSWITRPNIPASSLTLAITRTTTPVNKCGDSAFDLNSDFPDFYTSIQDFLIKKSFIEVLWLDFKDSVIK